MAKRPIKDIIAVGFKGMSNVLYPAATLVDKQTGLITPKLALNADIVNGVAVRRQGYSKKISLSEPHSLWGGTSAMLCVAQGSSSSQALYRVGTGSAIELTALPNVKTPMSYVEMGDYILCSSRLWNGMYNLGSQAIEDWGIALPVAPVLSLCDGDLVPGHYRVCYTTMSERYNRISGNGPISDIYWDSGNRGIHLDNLPASAIVWVTHADGGDFVLAYPRQDMIVDVYGTQKLPTLDMIPPPKLQWLQRSFGRIWGAVGSRVYYSEPMQHDRFKTNNFFDFSQDVVLIAPISDGIFVATSAATYFLAGRDPAKMSIGHSVGVGAIPGTLASGMVAGGGYQVSRKLSQIETVLWTSTAGIAMGVQGGHILYLTDGQNELYPRQQGGTLVRSAYGQQQIITTTYGSIIGESIPTDIDEILKTGRLI